MAINWYPGHMHKANREMTKVLPQVDLVIELLDCRLPYSSQNPAITRLAQGKPCIKILSKSDLADPAITAQWQHYFEREAAVKTLLTTLEQADRVQKLGQLCRKLVPKASGTKFSILAMISGIPNVGKSTLINAVAGRVIARTGDEPAITRGLQKIRVGDDLVFLDTPGILWPKIHNQNSGYRLAASGAIRDTAIEIEDIALFLVDFLRLHYPARLLERYQLGELPGNGISLLEAIGARRGCLRAGGRVDLEKVSSILVNEFRSGALGPITLETPEMIASEEAEGQRLHQAKAERDARRKNRKHSRRPLH